MGFHEVLECSITFRMLLSPSIRFYAMFFSEFGPSLSYLILSYLILSHLSDLLLASWVLVLGWLQISKRLSSCATTLGRHCCPDDGPPPHIVTSGNHQHTRSCQPNLHWKLYNPNTNTIPMVTLLTDSSSASLVLFTFTGALSTACLLLLNISKISLSSMGSRRRQ